MQPKKATTDATKKPVASTKPGPVKSTDKDAKPVARDSVSKPAQTGTKTSTNVAPKTSNTVASKPVASKPVAKEVSKPAAHKEDPKAVSKGAVKGKEEKKPAPADEKMNAPKKIEEPKKVEATIHEVKLPGIEIIIKQITENNKTPLIVDETGNFFTFLKYKGNLCDFQEYEVKKGMGKTSKEDFAEVIRTRIVNAMKIGTICALFIDKGLNNLAAFFEGVNYFKMPETLTPNLIKNEKFFKETYMKPEEDVDGFGNKGGFILNEDFRLVILANSDDVQKVKESIGYPEKYFEIVKIIA